MKDVANICVGECFRDTYYDDKPEWSHRTIKVVEVLPNGIRAEVIKDLTGERPKKPRFTTLQFKTLRAGYEPVVE